MEKLTNKEASNIYGGIAFAAFITLLVQVSVSITAIIKMSTASSGSVKNTGTTNEFKWDDKGSGSPTSSPAFFGY